MAARAPQNQAFDYDLSKEVYMGQIKKCFDDDSTHSEATIQRTIEVLKGSEKTHLHKYYDVSYAFGREILVEKPKIPDVEVQVLTYEDVFDVFIKFHIGNNHEGGIQYLLDKEKDLNCCYNYPTVCLSLIVKSCNVCRDLSRSRNPKSSIKTSSVFIAIMVQRQHTKKPDFKYILIHVDKATDFVLLRPLHQKSDIEVSMEIFKIMTQFGPPQKLCLHGYDTDFNKKIGSILRQVCPMFSFSIEYKSANFNPSAYIVNKLQEWMIKNASFSWEVGCSVVQNELNVQLKHKDKTHSKENKDMSPYELFYGKSAAPKTNTENVTGDNTKDNLNNEVVELRIPSPDNYNPDLLSQFEDSENSQELDVPTDTGTDIKPIKIIDEPKGVILIKTQNETDKKQLKKEESSGRTGKSVKVKRKTKESKVCEDMMKNMFHFKQKPKKKETPILLDMECEIDDPVENKEKSPVLERRKSMRIAKKVNTQNSSPKQTENNDEDEDDEMLGEYEVEEDLIYNPDDVNLEDAEDPLNVDLDA